MKTKTSFKDDLACNITLIVILIFTLVHLTLVLLNMFGAISLSLYPKYNHFIALALVICCLTLFILSFFLTRIKNLYIPAWFRILFYIAFYLFTNVYYILNLYQGIVWILIEFAYISFLANIISLSVFFNVEKDENHKLKTSSRFLTTTVFTYAVSINAILALVINIVKVILFPKYKFSTLICATLEFSTMLAVTLLITLIFTLSLKKTKTLINKCLIKTNFK